jgi:L-aspartate oxidase
MRTDTLIIGCGIGGATVALELAADRERRVTVLTRTSDPASSASDWAQGGIAGLGDDDTPERFVEDVLDAGAGLSSPAAARLLAEDGPGLIRRVLVEDAGVEFDRDEDGRLRLGLEAAHSRRRIYHVGDQTGEAIVSALLRKLRSLPNVELLTEQTAVDLLTFPHHALDPLTVYEPPACHGVYSLNRSTAKIEPILAAQTILATGGLGQLFLNTTNPAGSRGDGLAMAYRAGARVVNAEYVQFHPTALHMPGTTKALISEAVRGEGGVLLTPDGEPFMDRYDPRMELAPRDVVARAIYTEMLAHDYPYVLLDIASHRPASYIHERFPGIHAECRKHNLDISSRPVPVVPAAHYFCGGVLVDDHCRTTLPGLYAVGEVSCTGVHGANRLASTSLLEGLVWGVRAAKDIRQRTAGGVVSDDAVPPWDDAGLTHDADPALISGDMQSIRNLMWHYVGLRRNEYRLVRATRELRRLWFNIEEFYRDAYLTDALIGLRNMVLDGTVVAQAALRNRASRGCHYREDALPPQGAAPPDETNSVQPEME